MSEPQSTIVRLTTGTAATTFPFWGETIAIITGANQFLISLLGLLILYLTARKLWSEVKTAERKRRDAERGD